MIGIVVIATNAYFVLGLRFIKRFMHFYRGGQQIRFYFFSDQDPMPYLPYGFPIDYREQRHNYWHEGTNSKFKNILSLSYEPLDYIYYFDADTNIFKEFDENWFLGDLVGGEHFGNKCWMKDKKAYDRNPASKAYVPLDTDLPQMYYYGAFFGGRKDNLLQFCEILRSWQIEDKKIPYEPAVNDESYINAYFHYNPPNRTIPTSEFQFGISDKGGIGDTRAVALNVDQLKEEFLRLKDDLNINIFNGQIYTYN